MIIAGAAAVVLAAGGTATALAVGHSGARHVAADHHTVKARLAASACTGPKGAAYIALPGYQAFDAVNTDDCYLVQQYNEADGDVPGTGTSDTNYDSTDEGVAMYGNTLYFANTGNDTVGVLDTTALSVKNYENPAETLVHVGFDPQNLAVTPDGSQVWVAETGPQTGEPSLGGISVISTASDTVTSRLRLQTDPRNIAFSPSGGTAYVTTGEGLYVINTATLKVVTVIGGLGNPEGVAVSPDGKTVYVTNTVEGKVDVISAAVNRVTRTIQVGQMPWQLVLSSDGSTLYVADGDSNEISVINTASDRVTNSIPDPGDPVSLALTPDGSELWVGGLTSGIVTMFKTADGSSVGSFNVGYGGEANAGDGEEPTGIVITSTLTAGGS
ncbi:MAG TPA: YncE family protein [Streptosporangiaceae bacterium]|nr:YncE family protein [Streptosporangiaceae bacterium]